MRKTDDVMDTNTIRMKTGEALGGTGDHLEDTPISCIRRKPRENLLATV